MSKFQELQRELRYADQAKVSTAQLRQRLNDIIAQTSNADVTYTQDTENIAVPKVYAWTGTAWQYDGNIYARGFPRSVKITTDPLTNKEQKREYNPLGRKAWFMEFPQGLENVSTVHPFSTNISVIPTSEQLRQFASQKTEALRNRENLISELMNSKEFKDVHHLTNLRIVPEERRPKFRPRTYEGPQSLTTKSDPRLLVNVVNNLKKAMQRRGNSSAPIGRSAGDFFANILRRGE